MVITDVILNFLKKFILIHYGRRAFEFHVCITEKKLNWVSFSRNPFMFYNFMQFAKAINKDMFQYISK